MVVGCMVILAKRPARPQRCFPGEWGRGTKKDTRAPVEPASRVSTPRVRMSTSELYQMPTGNSTRVWHDPRPRTGLSGSLHRSDRSYEIPRGGSALDAAPPACYP